MPAGEPVTVGPQDRADGRGHEIGGLDGAVTSAFVALGLATWSVPAAALGVPGLLLLVVVALQSIGAAAWLPIARRWLSRATPRRSAAAEPDRTREG